MLLGSDTAKAEPPLEVASLRAKVVQPVGAGGGQRFLIEVDVAVRGLSPVPRGSDLAIAARCKIEDKPAHDRTRARAVQLHTIRPRQVRAYTLALFASRMLRKKPAQCEIATFYLEAGGEQEVLLARHCLQKGKSRVGSCTAKRGKKDRRDLAQHAHTDRFRAMMADKVTATVSANDARRGFIAH